MTESKKNPLLAQGVNDLPGANVAGPQSQFSGRVTSCVEVDLRNLSDLVAWEAIRHVQRALVGVTTGDVVKLLVDGTSETWLLTGVNMRGANVQITADSVYTRDAWVRAITEAVSE